MYNKDRAFTDYVHEKLAIPKIYNQLGWRPSKIDPRELEEMDIHKGIDYVFENHLGSIVKVQERFRDVAYKDYNDITLRYRRDNNFHQSRRKSEFFKIEADFFVYGITNGSKSEPETITDFIKFVVIDLNVLFDKINNSKIEIVNDSKRYNSYIKDNFMYCPIINNRDSSSSFVVLDVSQLHKLFSSDNIIVLQKGFINI